MLPMKKDMASLGNGVMVPPKTRISMVVSNEDRPQVYFSSLPLAWLSSSVCGTSTQGLLYEDPP